MSKTFNKIRILCMPATYCNANEIIGKALTFFKFLCTCFLCFAGVNFKKCCVSGSHPSFAHSPH